MNRIENGVIHSEIAAHVFGNTIDSSQSIEYCRKLFLLVVQRNFYAPNARVYLLKTELTLQKSWEINVGPGEIHYDTYLTLFDGFYWWGSRAKSKPLPRSCGWHIVWTVDPSLWPAALLWSLYEIQTHKRCLTWCLEWRSTLLRGEGAY